jgi:hypothetical protein
MNKEKQRIKIAEECGWRYSPYASLEVKQDAILSWIRPGNADWQPECLPDYLNDLNAMHEAEKIFKLGMRSRYDAELGLIAERDYCFIWETSAAQRAEAFLKTSNLWEE